MWVIPEVMFSCLRRRATVLTDWSLYWTALLLSVCFANYWTGHQSYAFIEYENEDDMRIAYKRGDGRKIDGRRVLVDVERGRTVRDWKPRRFGGGLGDSRKDRPKKGQEAEWRERERAEEAAKEAEREAKREKEKEERARREREREERDRSRAKDDDPDGRRGGSRDRGRRGDSRDRSRDRGYDDRRRRSRSRDRDRRR